MEKLVLFILIVSMYLIFAIILANISANVRAIIKILEEREVNEDDRTK